MNDRVGQQYGNYRLTRLLGRGGFAEVYLGEHLHLHTQAAIKVLQTHLSDQEAIENFTKEARIIAQLVHPHIIRTLDFGVEGNIPYLVMDYAPNGSLRQHLPKGVALPLTTILPYVKQVAEALDFAHSLRIIHRDIKPENMLVGRRNEVLLSDFGIAIMAQSSQYQGTQDLAGTIAYMAPEQIQGHPRPASDQYALAVVVYEWLSGRKLFQGTFSEVAAQHSMGTPPPLRGYVQVSEEVERALMKALAKNPAERYPSVMDFALALQRASENEVLATHAKGSGDAHPKAEVPPTVAARPTPYFTPPINPTIAATPPTPSFQQLQSSMTTSQQGYPPPAYPGSYYTPVSPSYAPQPYPPPPAYAPQPYPPLPSYAPQPYYQPPSYGYRAPRRKEKPLACVPLLKGRPQRTDLFALPGYCGTILVLLLIFVNGSISGTSWQWLPGILVTFLLLLAPALLGSWRGTLAFLAFWIEMLILTKTTTLPAQLLIFIVLTTISAWLIGFLKERRKIYDFLASWGLFTLEMFLFSFAFLIVDIAALNTPFGLFPIFLVIFVGSISCAVLELIAQAIAASMQKTVR